MKSFQQTIQNLRSAGLRITHQRRTIIRELMANPNHPTAEEIYEAVKGKLPDISLTTVYNTLKELKEIGEVELVRETNDISSRFDPNTDTHHHLCCLSCGEIVDLDDDFTGIELNTEDRSGFEIIRKQITFYGFCPRCQKNENTMKSSH